MNTRLIGFANSTVRVESDPGPATSLVEFLFPWAETGREFSSHLTLSLKREDGDSLSLYEAGLLSRSTSVKGDMAEWILGRVGFHLADKSHGGVLFHAAALYRNQHGLILPGRTGVGKTTLTCWLLSHGFGYMSDEFAFLPSGDLDLETFPRALNIKRTAMGSVKPFLRNASRDLALEGTYSAVMAAECFTAASPQSRIRLGLVVFPCFQPGARYSFEPMDPGKAGLALMETILNLRNLTRHGLSEIALLVRSLPVYHLTYGSFNQLELKGFLESLLGLFAKTK